MRKGVLFRPLSILLAVMMVVSIFTILPVTTASAATTTDTLTAADFQATGTQYANFSGVSKSSGAVYAGNSAKDSSGNIQLRSNNSNSGIVSTASGGTVKSVKITVGSGTKTVDVYGSNTAYTAATDLYGSNKGTKIGSLTATGTITPSADYAYVGIRSNSGAIYLSKVEIEWDNGSSPPAPATYTVTWKDGDGNTIETDTGVASGTTPSYGGVTPTKTADDYTYTFSGEWSDGTNTYATADLPAVTGDVTYTAQFSRVKNHPVVRWLNYDNEVLATETYDAYDTATYTGSEPTRPDSANYRYSFSGWDPVPAPLTDDTDYVAQYTQTLIPEYTVYWYDNEDDLNELASEDYKEGATPSYTGATPTKASDGTYNYYFDHKWKDIDSDIVYAEGELPPVADETYYIAQFRSVLASEDTLRTDVITRATTGVTGSSYSSWSNKSLAAESSGITSNAVYAGNSAGGNSAIQLRTTNSNSGIVTTASGGKVTKITVKWNDNTDDGGRTLDIYGDTTAYSSASLLYTNPKGTKLGSLYYKVDNVTTTELTIDGNYTFIGIRSHGSALYLDEIDITWDTAGAGYTVIWKNGDTVLETDTGLASGATPSYDGDEPTKDSDADYNYTFIGWSSDGGATVCTDTFPAVTADVTYVAQFVETPIPTHTVEWYNDDDCTDKLGEDTFKEGVRPSFSGTPTKASDGDYSYYFNHQWKDFLTGTVYNEDELPEVTDDAIYIAQYNAVVINKYTVTWADYDGAVLETDTNVIKDSTPAYDSALPSRDDDSDFSYIFAGWSPALAPVTADITYTAVYTATPLSMTAKILRTDADTEFYLAGKYYSYGGSTRQFDQDGSFSEAELEYDELYLGQLPVASVDVPSHAVFAHSVYVTGSGTASDPFIFTPNYIYASPDNSGVANGVAVSADGTHTSTVSVDAHPGDGFRKFSKARVTKDTNAALFL